MQQGSRWFPTGNQRPQAQLQGATEPRNPTCDSKGPSSCLCMDAGLTTISWCSSTQCAMCPLPPLRLQQQPQAFYCQDQVVGNQASRISAVLLCSPLTALPVKGASSSTIPGCFIPDTSTSSPTPPRPIHDLRSHLHTKHIGQISQTRQTRQIRQIRQMRQMRQMSQIGQPRRRPGTGKTRHLATVPLHHKLSACYLDQTQPTPSSPQPAQPPLLHSPEA